MQEAPDPYLAPDFWRFRDGATTLLWAFEDIVLQDDVIDAGGHWIAGVREFVHDPDRPDPQCLGILPVIAGQVWGHDLDPATADPLALDGSIRQRLDRLPDIKESREISADPRARTDEGFVSPAWLLARCAHNLRPQEPLDRERAAHAAQVRASFANRWPGRQRDCPWHGLIDDMGYELLMRVQSILNGLHTGLLRHIECWGTFEPKTHDLHRPVLESDWWDKLIKVDFERDLLYAGDRAADGTYRWRLMFSEVMIRNRRWLNREAAAVSQREIRQAPADSNLITGTIKKRIIAAHELQSPDARPNPQSSSVAGPGDQPAKSGRKPGDPLDRKQLNKDLATLWEQCEIDGATSGPKLADALVELRGEPYRRYSRKYLGGLALEQLTERLSGSQTLRPTGKLSDKSVSTVPSDIRRKTNA